jgi:hypothetical protein
MRRLSVASLTLLFVFACKDEAGSAWSPYTPASPPQELTTVQLVARDTILKLLKARVRSTAPTRQLDAAVRGLAGILCEWPEEETFPYTVEEYYPLELVEDATWAGCGALGVSKCVYYGSVSQRRNGGVASRCFP